MVTWRSAPIVFVLAGCATILSLGGADTLPLVAGWLLGATVIAALWRTTPATRIVLSFVLPPLCLLLTWEGGLFFLPGALALVGISVFESASEQRGPAAPTPDELTDTSLRGI